MAAVLVIDAGTSSVRSIALADDGTILAEHHREVLPSTPHPGLVEVDPAALAAAAIETATGVIDDVGSVDAVGIANQRTTTIAWDARTGEPVANGLGWQDVRTVGRCLELGAQGVRSAPNQSATKAEWLVQQAMASGSVRADDLRLGTVDTWLTWVLSEGRHHVTDASNASVTGLVDAALGWDPSLLTTLGIPAASLPAIVDSSGLVGAATALPGAPPIAGMVGDQQASLIGQGCIEPGQAKITFGTGGMLDLCLGPDAGPAPHRGTFTMVAWQTTDHRVYAREAVMLSAGTAVAWLRDGLGLIDHLGESSTLAASVDSTDGVVFVPSLHGLGTPVWDHGARGALFGVTRGTTRAHVVRAVLEGVAHRGADLVEATELDTGQRIEVVRIDGGMSVNPVFVQALADATGHAVEVSAIREATAVGAAYLAGVARGMWGSLAEAVTTRPDPTVVTPSGDATEQRERFADARSRAERWIPELSALEL